MSVANVITKEEVTEVAGKGEVTSRKEGVSGGGGGGGGNSGMQNQVGNVMLFGIPIVSLIMDGKERLCLAQISSTLLKDFSYNEIHNRRVALGINCVQCTPVQLEILRRAGAMPVTSRRCGMITRREAERLCKSFLGDHAPPQLPENFSFDVYHECGWGCRGSFVPSRYNSSRAKCIRCSFCQLFFSPNKFIFHSHRLPESRYVQPDAANFNSWRRHMKLCGDPPEETNSSASSITDLATAQIVHAWEDVKAMFNGGTRKRLLAATTTPSNSSGRQSGSSTSNGKGMGASGSSKSSQNHQHHHHHHPHSHLSSHNNHIESSSHSHINSKGSSGGGGSGSGSKKEAASTSNSVSSTSSHPQQPHHQQHQQQHSQQPLTILPSPVPFGSQPEHGPAPPHLQASPTFLHQAAAAAAAAQHHPFLNVSNPLISPGGRLTDSIWNPALQAAAARQAAQVVGPPPFPSLPFHPLSIPWLRRPLFPFSHPFGPTLISDSQPAPSSAVAASPPANDIPSPLEKSLKSQSSTSSSSSAFKPVSRNPVEPLFNWLNGNAFGIQQQLPSTSLPEDLSLHSSSSPSGAPIIASHSPNLLQLESSPPAKQIHRISTNNNTINAKHHHHNHPNLHHHHHHQVQILSAAPQTESDSEENVDIESTVETEECSSTTSSVWVSSTTSAAIGSKATNTGSINPLNISNNNNNNNSITIKRRHHHHHLPGKLSSLPTVTGRTRDYSSGEDDEAIINGPISRDEQTPDIDEDNDEDNSSIDNQEEWNHHHSDDIKIHSPSSSSSPPSHYHSQDTPKPKTSPSSANPSRKRLWVSEIISTTDEDDETPGVKHQQVMMVNSIPKVVNSSTKRNKLYHQNHHHHHKYSHHPHSNSNGRGRLLLETPE